MIRFILFAVLAAVTAPVIKSFEAWKKAMWAVAVLLASETIGRGMEKVWKKWKESKNK